MGVGGDDNVHATDHNSKLTILFLAVCFQQRWKSWSQVTISHLPRFRGWDSAWRLARLVAMICPLDVLSNCICWLPPGPRDTGILMNCWLPLPVTHRQHYLLYRHWSHNCHYLTYRLCGPLIMFCNLVSQQHLQSISLPQFFEKSPHQLIYILPSSQTRCLWHPTMLTGVCPCRSTPWTPPVLDDFRQTVIDITIFLSSSWIVAMWPVFPHKPAIICLEALLFPLNFTSGFSSGKTHTAQLFLRLGGCIDIPRFCLMSQCFNTRRSSSVKFTWHVGAPTYSTPLLLFTHVMGIQQAQHSLYQGSHEECEWDFLIKSSWNPVYQLMSYFDPSIYQRVSTLETFPRVMVIAIWPLSSHTRHELSQQLEQ